MKYMRPVKEAGKAVRRALTEGTPEARALLLERLRKQAASAIDRLGVLARSRGRRSSQQVALAANKLLLSLLDKAEARVEDDRLQAVEEAIEALKAAGKLPGQGAQPAPGADSGG